MNFTKSVLIIFALYVSGISVLAQNKILETSAPPDFSDATNNNASYYARDAVYLRPGFGFAADNTKTVNAYINLSSTGNINDFSSNNGTFDDRYLDKTTQSVPYSVLTNQSLGYTPGMAAVSSYGAGTYNIPIKIAPGSNGMEPSLAINYNSQGGKGVLGMGWDLSGLSSIVRVPKDFYHDGQLQEVQLTTADKFALDGNRLISKSGTYGADQTQYGTEIENFATIESYGTTGTGPDYFIVNTKDGKVIEYGNTADSKCAVLSVGGTTFITYMWRINKVTDENGNYMNFHYFNETSDSRIDYIEYTGNLNNSKLPYNRINFTYDYLQDISQFYFAKNASVRKKWLLHSIVVQSEGQLVREYVMDYVYDLYSKLARITETSSKGSLLNYTTVVWEDVQNIATPATPLLDFSSINSIGDFNGDGISDIIFVKPNAVTSDPYPLTLYLGTNNPSPNFIKYDVSISQENTETQGLNIQNISLGAADISGSGFDAIMIFDPSFIADDGSGINYKSRYFQGGIISYNQSNKTCVLNVGTPKKYTTNFEKGWSSTNFATMPADFDGDGRQDILLTDASNNFFDSSLPLSNIPDFNSPLSVTLIDLNGNGKTDILLQKENSRYAVFEYNSTSGSFENVTGDILSQPLSQVIAPGDFNGDGKTDILSNPFGNVSVSDGSSFITQEQNFNIPAASGTIVDIKAPSYLSNNALKFIVADLNSDSKSDVLYFTNADNTYTANVLFSDGDKFVQETFPVSNFSTDIFIGDFNGDGANDILIGKSSASQELIYMYKGSTGRLVKSITNGFGQATSFEYLPLTSGSAFYTKAESGDVNVIALNFPLHCVSSMTQPDGIGGTNPTTYTYNGAYIHRLGKGFLGFNSITETNNVHNTIKNTFYGYSDRYFPYISETDVSQNGTPISITQYVYNFGNFSDLRYFPYVYIENITNLLDGSVYTITNTYNTGSDPIDGNLKTTSTVYNNGTSDDGQTDITYTYKTFNSGIITKLETQTEVQTRKSGTPVITTTFSKATKFNYNASAQLTGIVDFSDKANKVTTTFTLGDYGNVSRKDVVASGISPSRTTGYTYDSYGRFVTSSTNALNISEGSIAYDGKWGVPTQSTDKDGLITNTEYDEWGSKVKEILPTGNAIYYVNDWTRDQVVTNAQYYTLVSGQNVPSVRTWYDAFGRELREESDNFSTTEITETQYDALGRLFKSSIPRSDGEAVHWITREYDDFDRIKKVTDVNANAETKYTYDKLVQTVTDPASRKSTYTFDAYGSVISEESPIGTSKTIYHATGEPSSVDAKGITIAYGYDPDYGRLSSYSDPSSGSVAYTYDALGEMLTANYNNGNYLYAYTYDALGRISTKVSSRIDGSVTLTDNLTYSYRTSKPGILEINNIVSSYQNSSKSYSYDNFGRVQSINESKGGRQFATSYNYDDFGNLSQVTYPSGFAVQNVYDAKGYFYKVQKADDQQPVWTLSHVDGRGNFIDGIYGNNIITTSRTYDGNYNLSGIQTGSVQNLGYTIDPLTRDVTHRKDQLPGRNLTEIFTPDPLDRLTKSEITGGLSVSVSYDARGNIATKSDAGIYAYSPSNADKLSQLQGNTGTISTDEQDIGYTPFQNVLSITQGNFAFTFNYGADGELAKMDKYSQGQLLRSTYYSGDYNLVTDANGNTIEEQHYIQGPYGQVALYKINSDGSTQLYNIHPDHLGSPVLLTTAESGTPVYEQSFDAWGRRRDPVTWQPLSGLTVTPLIAYGFSAKEHLDEIGLVNFGARMYDPVLGRWNAVDPAYQFTDVTPYGFANNNPLVYKDEDGRFIWLIFAAIGGTINVATNWNHINGDFGKGLQYFGVGAAAGAFGGVGAFVTGGAFLGAANAYLAGGSSQDIAKGAFIGGLAGGIGGALGGAVGNNIANKFLQYGVKGLVGGGGAGFTGGFLGGLSSGQSFGNALISGAQGGLYGAVLGGTLGFAGGAVANVRAGNNAWTGKPVASGRSPLAINNTSVRALPRFKTDPSSRFIDVTDRNSRSTNYKIQGSAQEYMAQLEEAYGSNFVQRGNVKIMMTPDGGKFVYRTSLNSNNGTTIDYTGPGSTDINVKLRFLRE